MRDETREVLNMLMHAFPSLGSWFAKQDASLSETWSKVLSHVDSDDAMTVVERFIRGDLDLPAGDAICKLLDGMNQTTGAEPSPILRQFVRSFGATGLDASVCAEDYRPFFEEAVGVIDDVCDIFDPPG